MIIGIDGGGSKTQFLLCNLEGQELASLVRPSIHYHQVGFATYQSTIQRGIQSLCQASACKERELQFICIGVPGHGELAADTQQLEQLAAKILPCPYELLNDVKLAWAGALACQAGISILAGTGSMAYAIDERGQNLRSGGWGQVFGDEGSAYWLGKEACRLFSKMADGRSEKGPLYDLMKERLGLSRDFDLIQYIYQMADQRKGIAGLASVLHQAYLAGDAAAWELFLRAAHELAEMVQALLPRYCGPRPVKVSYNGGVFRSGGAFIEELEQALKMQNCPVIVSSPKLSPVAGACLYSAQKLGLDAASFYTTLSTQQTAKPFPRMLT